MTTSSDLTPLIDQQQNELSRAWEAIVRRGRTSINPSYQHKKKVADIVQHTTWFQRPNCVYSNFATSGWSRISLPIWSVGGLQMYFLYLDYEQDGFLIVSRWDFGAIDG